MGAIVPQRRRPPQRAAARRRTDAGRDGERRSGVQRRQEVEDRAVERLGLIAIGEVPGRGQQREARVLDPVGHDLHRGERRVLVAAHEQRRRGDLRQPLGDVVHLQQRPERVGVADRREHPVHREDLVPRLRVELQAARDIGVGRDRELGHRVHAPAERNLDAASPHHEVGHRERQACRGRRVDGHQRADALWVGEGEPGRDAAAQRQSADDGAAEPEVVHQVAQVEDPVREGDPGRVLGAVRAGVSARLPEDEPMPGRERRDVGLPHPGVAADAVGEQHGLAASVLLIVDADAVSGREVSHGVQ